MNLFLKRYETLSIPLYKYYSNLEYAKDVIENSRIHFESPKTYNDIYDSTTYITDDQILNQYHKVEDIKEILELFLESKDKFKIFNYEFIVKYEGKDQITLKEIFEDFSTTFGNVQLDELIAVYRTIYSLSSVYSSDDLKISCFSENKDSLLMWSYYADSHKGVCLGFNIINDKELAEHCYKVQYSKHFNAGNESYIYFTKSEEWQHEKEWRIVTYESEYINTDSLCAIYLGTKMSSDDKFEFFRLAREYNLDLYLVKPSVREYKLEFKKILNKGEPIFSPDEYSQIQCEDN